MDPTSWKPQEIAPYLMGLIMLGVTLYTLTRNTSKEADQRYIAALEQMRKDDQAIMKALTESIIENRRRQDVMHDENVDIQTDNYRRLHDDFVAFRGEVHGDFTEMRQELRGNSGAMQAVINAVDRWRQQ